MDLKKSLPFKALPLAIAIGLAGCGDDNLDPDAINAPDTYVFPSTLNASVSNAAYYEAATTRLVLIRELKSLIDSDELKELAKTEGAESALERLLRPYNLGSSTSEIANLAHVNVYTDLSEPTPIRSIEADDLSLVQNNFNELTPDITLHEVMPGIQSDIIFRNSTNEEFGNFIGWKLGEVYDGDLYPDLLVTQLLQGIANQYAQESDHFNMNSGVDYQALVISFLEASISFSQITQFHLGQLPQNPTNTASTSNPNATQLQHDWDMAFGYYGSLQAPLQSNSPEVYNDRNNDQSIDLYTEYKYTLNQQAYTLDRTLLAETNFYESITESFFNGRQIIQEFGLGERESIQPELGRIHEKLIKEIERLLAAISIKYINEINRVIPYYRISDAYKKQFFSAWSTLKATTLALQFNPQSSLTYEELTELHDFIGNYPETSENFMSNYLKDLEKAKEKLINVYSFSGENADSW